MNQIEGAVLKFPYFVTFILPFSLLRAASPCDPWFYPGNVAPGRMCFLDCVALKTDKNTGFCPLLCPEYCNSSLAGTALFKISNLYPGLTLSERAVVAGFPAESTKAYAYSWKAENLCQDIYFRTETNDESDACRHYVWAGLLTKNLGQQMAQKILDAHETNPDEPLEEKSMDLANNRAGILACERLSESKKCDEKNLVLEFQSDLKSQKLIILKPKQKGVQK